MADDAMTEIEAEQDRDQGEPDQGVSMVSALVGGGVAAGFFLTTLFLLGGLGAYEAISILEATLPTIDSCALPPSRPLPPFCP